MKKFLKYFILCGLIFSLSSLSALAETKIYGYDTSSNQASTVNPIIGKELGYQFVYLRIGTGDNLDKTFYLDYAKAKAAGMKIGIYYAMSSKYPDAFTRERSVKSAELVLSWIKKYKIKLDMPIVYDMECTGMWTKANMMRNAIIYNAFTGVCNQAGYQTMYYCSAGRWRNTTMQSMIYDPIWIAAYGSNNGKEWGLPERIGRHIDIHQYTSGANVDEKEWFPYKLDRDILYTSFEELNRLDKTVTMYTMRDITIWTAPIKSDEYRLKKVTANYPIQVYPNPIAAIEGNDTFYRTVKGCYVLAKYMK